MTNPRFRPDTARSGAGRRSPRAQVARRPGARLVRGAAAVAVSAAVGAGCAGGAHTDASALLQGAKTALDNTTSAHFVLTSTNATTAGGTTITGGDGDVQRPDKLRGSLNIVVNGFKADVKVVAVGDQVYAQLPFATKYSKIDPSTFGLGNPGQLLDPNNGLSTLLSSATGAKVTGQERINGELVDEVSASVPGSKVPVLPDANPGSPVRLVAAIDPGNDQLRQVTLTGPFIKADSVSTFTLTLTNFGENVQITLPST